MRAPHDFTLGRPRPKPEMIGRLFDPGQARDDHGRWTDEGGGGGSSATQDIHTAFSKAQPEEFVKARDQSTRTGFLSASTAGDLTGHQLYLAHGGKVGYAIDPQGDIQNVFNNGGPKGSGADAMLSAIHQGGRTLDAYDGFLPGYYTQFGFEEVGRLRFNRDYAPSGWDYQRYGEPDVVLMRWKGFDGTEQQVRERVLGPRSGWLDEHPTQRYFESFDEGAAARRAAEQPRRVAASRLHRGGTGNPDGNGEDEGLGVDARTRRASARSMASGERPAVEHISLALIRTSIHALATRNFEALEWHEEDHPRVPSGESGGGQFTSGGGGGGTAGSGKADATGGKAEPGTTDAKGVYHPTDVEDAVRALGEDKKIEFEQPRELSTFLDRLAKVAEDARQRGENSRRYNLCNVSVAGTNLFCAESKGIPRLQMPQLSGKPLPGSRADAELPKDSKGEVNIGPLFEKYLLDTGVSVTDETVSASVLRASQNELDGSKVAGMMGAISAGKLPPGSIFTSRDDYVVDGHHRWAANVGVDVNDNHLGDVQMSIRKVDMPILDVLKEANDFAGYWGLPQVSIPAGLKGVKAAAQLPFAFTRTTSRAFQRASQAAASGRKAAAAAAAKARARSRA